MRTKFRFHLKFGVVLITVSMATLCHGQMTDNTAPADKGRSTYNASCAGCHGLDGRGSDKAVNIGTSPAVQNLSDAELTNIISQGVVESGMPAFRSLSEKQLQSLVAYLRQLQGKGDAVRLPGDPKHGQEIFFGNANCGQCHTVAGQGGFLGPDLTNHAATSSADVLREEIVQSSRIPTPRYRLASLTTTTGTRLEGLVRNEDNFSVQLQARDGSFHLLKKTDIKALEYANGALMPTDYRSRLSESELNDLISYLLTSPDRKALSPHEKKWDEDEE
jgi:cytochrome c oxidase cbb3-type subunit III